jgi:glucose-6-phosphate-specific signal transduction histidine kinase
MADDGVGGADGAAGTGLRGLLERLSAVGGRLEIASPPRQGTTGRAAGPAERRADCGRRPTDDGMVPRPLVP